MYVKVLTGDVCAHMCYNLFQIIQFYYIFVYIHIYFFVVDTKQTHQRSNAEGKPERNFNKYNNENREERNNRRNREDRPYNGPAENR